MHAGLTLMALDAGARHSGRIVEKSVPVRRGCTTRKWRAGIRGCHCEEAYADEAISERPEAKIAAPAFVRLAMTSGAFAAILSYTLRKGLSRFRGIEHGRRPAQACRWLFVSRASYPRFAGACALDTTIGKLRRLGSERVSNPIGRIWGPELLPLPSTAFYLDRTGLRLPPDGRFVLADKAVR